MAILPVPEGSQALPPLFFILEAFTSQVASSKIPWYTTQKEAWKASNDAASNRCLGLGKASKHTIKMRFPWQGENLRTLE